MSLYPPPSAPYPLYVAYPALVALAAFRCPPPTAVDVVDVVAVAEPEEEEDEEEEVEEEVEVEKDEEEEEEEVMPPPPRAPIVPPDDVPPTTSPSRTISCTRATDSNRPSLSSVPPTSTGISSRSNLKGRGGGWPHMPFGRCM